jgi:hypothetical protein
MTFPIGAAASRAAIARALLTVMTGAGLAAAAHAVVIHPVYDSSITSLSNATQIEAAFNAVANDYARSLAAPVTVNVGVSWGSVGGQALPSSAVGASIDNLYGYFTYSQVKGFLTSSAANNPTNTSLTTAVKYLPSTTPSGVSKYVVASSQAKALGLISGSQSSLDGSIGFAGSTSNYAFSPSSVSSGKYDFSAVAAHELDEVLGRISGVDSNGSYRTPFDLFCYGSAGNLSYSYNAASYFSIDGGKTALGHFNYSASGGDRGDWATTSSTTDVQDAFISPGQRKNLLAVDFTALDALGWGGSNLGNTATSTPDKIAFNLIRDPEGVPEPSSWLTMVAGFSLMGVCLRKRSMPFSTISRG